ncbi:MAG TPA: hypothetical protein VG839_05070 [Asticcacaulis sp.]|nr:hypothetical protein [Asticcacaulis sp.]
MALITELWQTGIVHAPAARLLDAKALHTAEITWLPDPGPFRFNADPFGVKHDGGFTVMVEALDYRIKRGEIHYYTYNADWSLARRGVALRQPFHLSYPSLIEDGGDIYMLPEASRSGKLTLYRAERFPDRWQPVANLLDIPAIDASVIRHDERWWMFHALPGEDNRAMRELHVVHAPSLKGPWTQHSGNPVRTGLDASRPGGTPFVHEGKLHLPVQDCIGGYGVGLNILRIDDLTPDRFAAEVVSNLSPGRLLAGYNDGLHTLSACGDVTLIDVKRLHASGARAWVDLERRITRAFGRR